MKNSADSEIVHTITVSNIRNGSAAMPYLLLDYTDADTLNTPIPGIGVFTLEYMRPSTEWVNNFELYEDVDLNDPNNPKTGVAGTDNWTPIGYRNNSDDVDGLPHSFYGNYHEIKNLTIQNSSLPYIGLFAGAGTNETSTPSNPASIQALGVTNVTLTGDHASGIIAAASGYLNINQCYTTGTINVSDGNSAGIIGLNEGVISITQCYSECNITSTGGDLVGGIAGGDVGDGNWTVSQCYSTGNISGVGTVGGIIGVYEAGTVDNCYSTGNISGGGYTGGIVGDTYGNITNCFSTAKVTGSTVGGILGNFDNSGDIMTGCVAMNATITGSSVDIVEGATIGTITGCAVFSCVMVNGIRADALPATTLYSFWNTVVATTPASYSGIGFDLTKVWEYPAVGGGYSSDYNSGQTTATPANLPILKAFDIVHFPNAVQNPNVAPCP
jgi:hypothetical protein